MQASPPAAAGVVPAALAGMLRSRLIPAFVCVALMHVVLVAIFVAANRTPTARDVQPPAIVAQLLRSQADTGAAAVQSRSEPSPKRASPERDRPHISPAPQHVAQPHVPAAAAAPAAHALAPGPAPAQVPARTSAPATSPASTSAQTAAATANLSPATVGATGASSASSTPGAQETIAIAAPKHVEHVECRIVKPAYPELSKRRGETGTATLRLVVGTTGAIDTVTLVKSSGFARLDDAAVQALRESRCQPYVENGTPIRASVVQAFTFGLDDD
jgi:protein TonB